MGFALTILYVVLTIISPTQLGPWAGEYRPMVALTTVIVVVSLPELLGHRNLWSSTQTFLLVGFTMAIAVSRATNGWLGGAVQSWLAFLPAVSLFFFIVERYHHSQAKNSYGSDCFVMPVRCGRGHVWILRRVSRNDFHTGARRLCSR